MLFIGKFQPKIYIHRTQVGNTLVIYQFQF